MPQTPTQLVASHAYEEGWRAVNELIRADHSWSGRERNVCYRNLRDGRFEDVSYTTGLDFADDGRAWVSLDLDGDGDLDLVLKSRTEPQLRLLRNELGGANHGLVIELEGGKSNRDAVGAEARLVTTAGRRLRFVRSGSGFLSQTSRRLHFGIAADERIQGLEIVWPSGLRQFIHELPVRGSIRIREGADRWEQLSGTVPRRPFATSSETIEERPWLAEPLPFPDARFVPYRGKKVLVNLWASWCPPCLAELKDFTSQAAAFTKAGVQIILLRVDGPSSTGLAGPFPTVAADDRTIGVYTVFYRYLFDRRRDMGLPLSFLLDEKGALIKIYQGSTPAAEILADAASPSRPSLPFAGVRYTEPRRRNVNDLATALTERGFLPEARTLFEQALTKGYGGFELYNNYAGLLVAAGETAAAEKMLRTSIRENPRQGSSHANLGLLLLDQNRSGEAAPFLENAIRLQPDDSRSRRALSSLYNDQGVDAMQAGRKAEALRAFEKAANVDPSDPAVQMNLALYHFEAGDREKARLILRGLLERHPDHQGARDLVRQLQ